MQEEFMRESKLLSEPATKCTRIQRKPAAGEAAQQQEQGQQQQKLQHDAKPKPAIASDKAYISPALALVGKEERGLQSCTCLRRQLSCYAGS
eukprot:1144154-Pelagomonas_calceolata.AAC.6